MLFLAAMFACSGDSEDVFVQIFPADGQTDVGLNQPLYLDGYALVYPDSAVLPQFVDVVDLSTGELVEGELERTNLGVRFVPAQPWTAGASYLWSAHPPLDETRQPDVLFPLDDQGQIYAGSASFSTNGSVRPLLAHHTGSEACLVTSRPLLAVELDDVRFQIGEEIVRPDAIEVIGSDVFEIGVLPEGDRGLGVVCALLEEPLVRAWLGDQAVLATPGNLSPQVAVTQYARRLQ